MTQAVTLQIPLPLQQVGVVGQAGNLPEEKLTAEQKLARQQEKHQQEIQQLKQQMMQLQQQTQQQIEQERQLLAQSGRALITAGEQIQQMQQTMEQTMKSEAVRLAMAVASRVVHKAIEQGDYDIDAIVAESMKQLPKHGSMEVRLNPDDLKRCGLSEQASGSVRFVADAALTAGSCHVHSVEGMIETSPQESLQRIEETLEEELD